MRPMPYRVAIRRKRVKKPIVRLARDLDEVMDILKRYLTTYLTITPTVELEFRDARNHLLGRFTITKP